MSDLFYFLTDRDHHHMYLILLTRAGIVTSIQRKKEFTLAKGCIESWTENSLTFSSTGTTDKLKR